MRSDKIDKALKIDRQKHQQYFINRSITAFVTKKTFLLIHKHLLVPILKFNTDI